MNGSDARSTKMFEQMKLPISPNVQQVRKNTRGNFAHFQARQPPSAVVKRWHRDMEISRFLHSPHLFTSIV
jgi:hypothetical protein